MNDKYEFTEETKQFNDITLHRIRAKKDFGDVKAGDLGGWIEKEDNLCIDGDAWVYGNARVYGNAWVYGNARVYGNAWVYGNAEVCGNARVYGNADILWITKIGSRLATTTVYRNKDKGLTISCGCFLGTLEEFNKKVEQTHGDTKYGREYKALIELIKIHFDIAQ